MREKVCNWNSHSLFLFIGYLATDETKNTTLTELVTNQLLHQKGAFNDFRASSEPSSLVEYCRILDTAL